jgi:transketolase
MRKTSLEQVYELAKKDKRVVFIGSDIGSGTLDKFRREMPERFFMEGVSESHLIGMMTGLALSGKIPYLNTIASFICKRPFEHILLDAALHRAKVRLIGSGGGVVYGPLGPTHLTLEDIAVLRAIPDMTILAPCDGEEMKRLMPETLDYDGPIYIRLGKGGERIVSRSDLPFKIGKAIVLREGNDVLIVSTGATTQLALAASEQLALNGVSAAMIHLHTLKPVDSECLKKWMEKVRAVITVEEHYVTGGLGSIVADLMADTGPGSVKRFARIGFPNAFLHAYGTQEELMKRYGITTERIVKTATALLAKL